MTRRASLIASSVLVAAWLGSGPAFAQDDEVDIDVDNAVAAIDDIDREPDRCIRIAGIDETHIVDDQTILFYMRNDDVYQNVLRFECRGLKSADTFSYTSLGGNLCLTDAVSVIRFRDMGRTCGLGPFIRISEEEAEFLRFGERPLATDERVELPQDEEDSD